MANKRTIESDAIALELNDDSSFSCELRSNLGRYVRITRNAASDSPEVDGDRLLTENPAIVESLWLAAVAHVEALEMEANPPRVEASGTLDLKELKDIEKVIRRQEKEQASKIAELRKQAKDSATYATRLAELMDIVTLEAEPGYCSCCLGKTDHQEVGGKRVFICAECGNATARCTMPKCENFGAADLSVVPTPVICAEHKHEVPDFTRLDLRLDDPTEFEELRQFRVVDVTRAAKITTAGAVTLALGATGGLYLAPAVGAMVGTSFLGLTGAAAQYSGLAMLGFGSLASGGLGMAGGSMVVAAAGGLLGSAFGVEVLNSYLGEDTSFGITRVREGAGVPVFIARGFTTEKKESWRTEVRTVERAYPDSPIYLVSWGSKELLELAGFLSPGLGLAGGFAVKQVVKHASRQFAQKMSPVGLAIGTADLLKNPWHTAVNRANKTALVLAAILQRTNIDSCVLVGHSLGGRVMLNLAAALCGVEGIRVEAVHLLGAAVGQGEKWRVLDSPQVGAVHNYHSTNDNVLGKLYPLAMVGRLPLGYTGFQDAAGKVVDHDVSTCVKSHSAYYDEVELVR